MKKKAGYVAMMLCIAAFSWPAFSLDIDSFMPNKGDKPDKEVTPPQYAVPLPEAPQPPKPAEDAIPKLPPSLPCKTQWMFGLWELQHVYESPPGKETQAYIVSPVQYIAFGKDTRFSRYNAGPTQMKPWEAMEQMSKHSGALLQYVLQDNGMLFLYQDRVAYETMVCFIVAEAVPPYAAGNLLLMPPKGQVAGRMVKVYKKIWSPAKPPPPPAPVPSRPYQRRQPGIPPNGGR